MSGARDNRQRREPHQAITLRDVARLTRTTRTTPMTVSSIINGSSGSAVPRESH